MKDLTPPAVSIVFPIADYVHNAAVPITVIAADNASGVDTVEYRVDNGQWKLLPIADRTQGRYSTTWEPTLADNGPHRVDFRAWDKVENASAAVSAGFVVQMDAVPPVTVIAVGGPKYELPDRIFVNGSTVITLTATDNFSGVAKTEYSIDDEPWTSYAPFSIAAEGSHLIEYRSEDNAGNRETEKTLNVVVDNTPPVTSISASDPLIEGVVNAVSLGTFFTLSSIDALSGVMTITYRIDGGAWEPYTGSFNLAGRSAGLHMISYKATDNVLNEETVQTLTVRLIILEVVKKIDNSPVVLVGLRHDDGCDEDEHHFPDSEKAHRDSDGEDEHDRCGDYSRKTGSGEKRLSDILTTAGIEHHIAHDEDDFTASLRSGKYNTYILMDFKEEDIAEEIREAVYSGSGLIFLKTLPFTDPGLGEAFGVKFTGKTTDSDITVTLFDIPLSNERSLFLSSKGVVASITDNSVQAFAPLEDKHGSHPAVVFNRYGNGNVLLYAFDLLSVSDHALTSALLINSVAFVRMIEHQPAPMAGLPISIQITNGQEQAEVKISETIPAGASLGGVRPPAADKNGAITWQKSLLAGERAVFGYTLNLPDTAGGIETVTEVAYNNNGSYRPYGRYGLSLSVDFDNWELLMDIVAALNGITATKKEDAAVITKMIK